MMLLLLFFFCMSPTSQNELIEIVGKRIIQEKIIEIKVAQYHYVLAYKATNSNDEILLVFAM